MSNLQMGSQKFNQCRSCKIEVARAIGLTVSGN